MAKRIIESSGLSSGLKLNISFENQETNVQVVEICDDDSGLACEVLVTNSLVPTATLVARIGARHSRSSIGVAAIATEELNNRELMSDRLGKIVAEYGHASPSDMSTVNLGLRLPQLDAYRLFNANSTDQGQEKSTRYVTEVNPTAISFRQAATSNFWQSLSEAEKTEYSKNWTMIMDKSFQNYNDWLIILSTALNKHLASNQVDNIAAIVRSRSLDVARNFLPLGAKTEMFLPMTVRNLKNIADTFMQSTMRQPQSQARLLLAALSLGAFEEVGTSNYDNFLGSLSYQEVTTTSQKSILNIKKYLQDNLTSTNNNARCSYQTVSLLPESQEELLLHNLILYAFPNLSLDERQQIQVSLTDENKSYIASELSQFGHHDFFPSVGDNRGLAVEYHGPLSCHRDFNRHRAFARISPILNSCVSFPETIDLGFIVSPVIHESTFWSDLEQTYISDFNDTYDNISHFYSKLSNRYDAQDLEFFKYLLPLGHAERVVNCAPINQWNYMINLRTAGGGDMAYRLAAYEMADAVCRKSSFLGKLLGELTRPNLNNIDEIRSRS